MIILVASSCVFCNPITQYIGTGSTVACKHNLVFQVPIPAAWFEPQRFSYHSRLNADNEAIS